MIGERRRVASAVALILALAVAGCASSTTHSASSSTTTTARHGTTTTARGPHSTATSTGRPTAGACLEPMTPLVAGGYQLPAVVPCSEPHGGEIIAVARLTVAATAPYPATTSTLTGIDSAVTACVGDTTHLGQFGDFVGTNALTVPAALSATTGITEAYSVSGLQAAMYVSGTAAWARGDRWLACAAVLSNSNAVPSSYTGTAKGARAARGKLADQLAWCKDQTDPTDSSTYQVVPCSQEHDFEQVASFTAGSSTADYPGAQTIDHLASQLCAPLTSAGTGGRTDHLSAKYGLSWTYPEQADWTSGSRIVRCYVATLKGTTTGAVGAGTDHPSS